MKCSSSDALSLHDGLATARVYNSLSCWLPILIPCTEPEPPFFTDIGQKNIPYFRPKEDFCCKKNRHFFPNFKESTLRDDYRPLLK